MSKHFILTAYGSAGDIFPFVEIGRYLLTQNHRVTFITLPWFEALIKESGMTYIQLGTMDQAVDLLNDPEVWNPRKGLTVIWRKGLGTNLLAIRSYVQSLDPDEEVVILAHPALMPTADLARPGRANLKIVVVHPNPTPISQCATRTYYGGVSMGEGMAPPKFPKRVTKLLFSLIDSLFLDREIVPALNRERLRLGMTPIRHFLSHMQYAADLYVTLFPEWFCPNKPDYPSPLINGDFVFFPSSGAEMSSELTEFLAAGSAPIVFTSGTGFPHVKKYFQIALDTVQRINARAIFLCKFPEQVPSDLPPSVLWQEYVPFEMILPKVAIVVHHGGAGTFAEAGRAGMPQLAIPIAYDQFDNALIIKDLGVGEAIPSQYLTVARLERKLTEMLGSQAMREKCKQVAAHFTSGLKVSQTTDKILAAI
ncbi:MAG: nucleotide disphospho-sugar-binding domain-containing protein [Terracidiphilus sp.]|jgi:rhamnosyltransferase subunit B